MQITVDGKNIEVKEGQNVLQACLDAGINIPHFCYHPKLSLGGGCRMCLVEIEGETDPVISCGYKVREGLVVATKSEKVIKARQAVLEVLLASHPLDCPVCDKAGECTLQDYSIAHGLDKAKYHIKKRSFAELELGPLVKTNLNRCILCHRCVRFLKGVVGDKTLGSRGSGANTSISNDGVLKTVLAGNLIDLCPTGALEDATRSAEFRPWELQTTPSIDVLDAVGSHILVSTRKNKLARITPDKCEEINECWLSDKARYAPLALNENRITDYSVNCYNSDQDKALDVIVGKLEHTKKIAAIAGPLCDAETMYAFKQILDKLGSDNYSCCFDGMRVDLDNPRSWLFNSKFTGLKDCDGVYLLGCNPQLEAPVVALRIKNKPQMHIRNLAELERADRFKNPAVVVGAQVLCRPEGAEIAGMLAARFPNYNLLHTAASRVGGLALGFYKDHIDLQGMDVVFNLGCDEWEIEDGGPFVIYIGHSWDRGVRRSDMIIPAPSYLEKATTFINMEGRVQKTSIAVKKPQGVSRETTIAKAIAYRLGMNINEFSPEVMTHLNTEAPAKAVPWCNFDIDLSGSPYGFFESDVLTRTSQTMQALRESWGGGS